MNYFELYDIENHLDLDTEGMEQLAQITIDGVYRYELHWKPATNEVAIETVNSSVITWHPDTFTVGKTLNTLLGFDLDEMRITGLGFFGVNVDDYHVASPEEDRDICEMQWNRIGADGYAVQFNVDIDYDYDDGSAPPRADHTESIRTDQEHADAERDYYDNEFKKWHAEFRERSRVSGEWGAEWA